MTPLSSTKYAPARPDYEFGYIGNLLIRGRADLTLSRLDGERHWMFKDLMHYAVTEESEKKCGKRFSYPVHFHH